MLWLLPVIAVAYDFTKDPIDRLYFQNPWRPVVGVRNALVDLVFWGSRHNIHDYPGLWTLQAHWKNIKREFDSMKESTPKYFFHDLDDWFPHNKNYYYYKIQDFPNLKKLVGRIPCVDKTTGVLAVMDGPSSLPPHRAESNLQLRYQLTLEGSGESVLRTKRGAHRQRPGEAFLFDHGRYHAVENKGEGERVVLILDIKRVF